VKLSSLNHNLLLKTRPAHPDKTSGCPELKMISHCDKKLLTGELDSVASVSVTWAVSDPPLVLASAPDKPLSPPVNMQGLVVEIGRRRWGSVPCHWGEARLGRLGLTPHS